MMLSMSREESVKAFIILADSGGGSSAAVGMMVDAINEIKKEKRVIGVVEKGGMAASACYGILSACNEIYAEDPMSVVGSVGTMIQFEGFAANAKTPEGLKNIRVYASKSTRKNEAFEQALNEDKYTLLIDGLLDPINEDFIKTILSNRPVLSATTFDDGRTHLAGKVVGTFIDGIKSFDEVVNKIAIDLKNNNPINTNNKRTMTKAEIKTANPEAYAEILAEGMAMEKDRAGAWLAHMATDSAAVVEGIASGGNISSSQREEFFVKQNSITNAAKMITNSAPDVLTGESKTNVSGAALESLGDKVEAAFDFKLN
jgi:ClpP class serine protease